MRKIEMLWKKCADQILVYSLFFSTSLASISALVSNRCLLIPGLGVLIFCPFVHWARPGSLLQTMRSAAAIQAIFYATFAFYLIMCSSLHPTGAFNARATKVLLSLFGFTIPVWAAIISSIFILNKPIRDDDIIRSSFWLCIGYISTAAILAIIWLITRRFFYS